MIALREAVARAGRAVAARWRTGGSRGSRPADDGALRVAQEEPSPALVAALEERLYEFNADATGLRDGRGLAVVARDARGAVAAAAAGYTWGGMSEVRQLWVRDDLRGRGLGTRLLREAEEEARRRGCDRMFLSTHSFQAPAFYRKLGYVEVAQVSGWPPGHGHIYLRKHLRAGSEGS